MSSKEKQFSVRLNDNLHQQATNKSESMNISLAELVRLSLGSYCTQMGSPSGSESESLLKLKLEASNEAKDRADQIITQLSNQIERQNNQLEAFNEARTRSDTIIMQLSQQIDRQQLQLEDIRRNRSIFARIRDVFIPPSTSTPRLSDHFRCVNRWLMVALFFYIRDTTESETDASKIA